jgi:AraC family transcriptional regulator
MSKDHSAQLGHLVRRAITVFETDRQAAWRYLNDAARLLGTGPLEPYNDSKAIDSQTTLNAPQRGGLGNWQAKRAIAHIEANLDSKIPICALAELVDLSKSHFTRAFKCSVGIPPGAYISRRRVERAKLIITSTGERLASIALGCGFSDQPHLTRSFRRLVGTTPGAWRRNSAEPNPGDMRCDDEGS